MRNHYAVDSQNGYMEKRLRRGIPVSEFERVILFGLTGRTYNATMRSRIIGAVQPMNEPVVSIVLPLYNGAAFVEETLASVAAQTFKDAELIVVDDGSTDNSADIVTRMCAESSSRLLQSLTLLSQENQGVAAARNSGIDKARGKWIAFLDQDDLWLPEKLAVQMSTLRERPSARWHYSALVRFYGDGREKTKRNGSQDRAETLRRLLSGELFIPPSAALVARQACEALGGFDSAFVPSDEWDFFLKLIERFEHVYSPECLVRFRSHETSTAKRQKRRIFEAQLKVLEKHAPATEEAVPRSVIKQRRANILWHLGHECRRDGDIPAARAYYRKAFLSHPARVKLLAAVVRSCLPTWTRRKQAGMDG